MSSDVLKFLRSGVWAKFVLQFLFPPSTEKTRRDRSPDKWEKGRGKLRLPLAVQVLKPVSPMVATLSRSTRFYSHSGLLLFEYLSTIFKYSVPSKFDSVEITR